MYTRTQMSIHTWDIPFNIQHTSDHEEYTQTHEMRLYKHAKRHTIPTHTKSIFHHHFPPPLSARCHW